ncbi:MAG TPA: maleylpyruvate isomerase family mycothiol-dependent enzyme [Segeticoccus sp.]|nr:maleylpyruvate isomerase family mycothiol-dependent enzyme [Segeticoccus sp.]
MSDDLDYLDHLSRDSARFREVLRDADPGSAVPSCPGWTADDLLWHLAEVQWFWSRVVGGPITDGSEVSSLEHPERPADRVALLAFFDRSSGELQQALGATSPETPAWTWSSEQTAGFTRRRQAHEALIHRLDAELTTGRRTDLDPALAADGVLEALAVMFGGHPPWGTFTPEEGRLVRFRATDTGDEWWVTLGRFVGRDPDADGDGAEVDEDDIGIVAPAAGAEAPATISGTAADLDAWLWHRPPSGEVSTDGDSATLERVGAILSQPIN